MNDLIEPDVEAISSPPVETHVTQAELLVYRDTYRHMREAEDAVGKMRVKILAATSFEKGRLRCYLNQKRAWHFTLPGLKKVLDSDTLRLLEDNDPRTIYFQIAIWDSHTGCRN